MPVENDIYLFYSFVRFVFFVRFGEKNYREISPQPLIHLDLSLSFSFFWHQMWRRSFPHVVYLGGRGARSHGLTSPLWVFRHKASKPDDKVALEVSDPSKASVATRGYSVFTLQEFVDKEDTLNTPREQLVETISQKMENPMWMLYALGFVWLSVSLAILSHRLRTERKRFDPRMRKVRTFDQPGGPLIGGPFTLTDTNGKTVRNTDFLGKFMYIYFGFTNCPDICPAEMEKLSRTITQLDKKVGKDKWVPLFITVDPYRDTPKVLKEYLSDFHPRIIGLTGSQEEIERVARSYRVYFAVPDESTNPNDYLVDHSIIMYLMSPEGKFLDYTTKDFNWMECLGKILRRMMMYDEEKANSVSSIMVAPQKK